MEKPFEDFGILVFGEKEMKERLPKPVYEAWKKTVANEESLERTTADAIAHAMKRWAMENGATHFTHWFQPLTGGTAEKHDAFIEPDSQGDPISRFSGKMLIKGEPDASSFPSGGLRATFEARGYTYWDVTSPVFIREEVLCIPTIFVSYNGEALDRKEPLLKSLDALSKAATRVVNLLGDKDVRSCNISVGLEQEYFLVDKKYFDQRLDLRLCGRTLFGTAATKGQELSDHYFGAIPTRVKAFMKDVNEQLWKLGIFAKTEHNEAAPAQFELAPIFTTGNMAVDQNQLTMDILRKTAERHGFACLLHEKPFYGINGSGKHNNYSIITDDGQNLFDPGKKPAENIRFLTFMCAFIEAVDNYALLLRLSASSAGNDHRLGAHEAPPAIISIYLGSYIEDILFSLYQDHPSIRKDASTVDFTPLTNLAYIPHDNADRNRTSPLAFTGNKFEFRMLGSSMNASALNTIINTALASVLDEIADKLENVKYRQDVRELALEIICDIYKKHKRVLFSGNGYSEEWVKEANKRKLPNIKTFVEAISEFSKDYSVELFEKYHVYSKKEIEARSEIMYESYVNIRSIEIKTMTSIIYQQIIPSAIKEMAMITSINEKYWSNSMKTKVEKLADFIDLCSEKAGLIEDNIRSLDSIDSIEEKGMCILNKIIPLSEQLRVIADKMEHYISVDNLSLPSYEKLFFNIDY